MTFRYFYSTEESDTALKAILDASEYIDDYSRNENTLTDGVIEYKIEMDSVGDFLNLQRKIDDAHIRAVASPERIVQFGNIRPDNYFNSDEYASGCLYRSIDTLANNVSFFSMFPTGTILAQRDLDMYGSASLGTIALTLSSKYKKTYNVPINGSVNDKTLVKTVIDSTTPALTQTNATCNSSMFDYSEISDITNLSTDTANATWMAAAIDRKYDLGTDAYTASGETKTIKLDLGAIFNTTTRLWLKTTLTTNTAPSVATASIDIYAGATPSPTTNIYSRSRTSDSGAVTYDELISVTSPVRYITIVEYGQLAGDMVQCWCRDIIAK